MKSLKVRMKHTRRPLIKKSSYVPISRIVFINFYRDSSFLRSLYADLY